MHKYALVIFLFLGCFQLQGQENLNIEQVAHVPLDRKANDIWGFVDRNGTEYAIIGTRDDTRIFSLEDPSEPNLRATISGANSMWRDIKSFGDFLYVIADRGSDGLVVIDMSEAPEEITFNKLNLEITGGKINRCHNLYVDEENALLFTAGCNTLGGILAFDLTEDAANPKFLSKISNNYSHDVFAQNKLVYSSEINNGQLAIYDVSIIKNPTLLGFVKTSSFFTHNAWADNDDNYVYTTDEVSNGKVDAYDISDKSNPIRVDEFVPLAVKGKGTVPHNTHYLDDYLITSWYTYGVVIIDVAKPEKMVEVGHFDTHMGSGSGCWGTYPYLPSGLILASDIDNGLFILQPKYERTAYLTGNITDGKSGIPIVNANVTVLSTFPNGDVSDLKGNYTTGQLEEGVFEVIFDHPDYDSKSVMVNFRKDIPAELDVRLKKSQEYDLDFKVVTAIDENINNAHIQIINDENQYDLQTDNGGHAQGVIVSGQYDIIVGKWGYQYTVIQNIELGSAQQYTIQLDPGYEDDFIFDYNWTTITPNARSEWVRVAPIATDYEGQPSNPGEDLLDDLGNKCYVTGNGSGGAGQYDVDDGASILISPNIDLSDKTNAILKFSPWFFNDGGSETDPNDTFKIFASNKIENVLLTEIFKNTEGWSEEKTIILSDFITLNDSIQIIFSVADDVNSHLVEAGLDGFKIIADSSVNTNEEVAEQSNWSILTNPTSKNIKLKSKGKSENVKFTLYNLEGKLIDSIDYEEVFDNFIIEIQRPVSNGIYFMNIASNGKSEVLKIIIQD